jgi:hypothetical protein
MKARSYIPLAVRERVRKRLFLFKAEISNITSKRNCILHYQFCLVLRAITIKSNNDSYDSKAITVPDLGSRDRDVVLVRCTIDLGKPRGSQIWNGVGRGKGRSVYQQPGTKVDRIASRQRRVSK